jgi:hypothetical protein
MFLFHCILVIFFATHAPRRVSAKFTLKSNTARASGDRIKTKNSQWLHLRQYYSFKKKKNILARPSSNRWLGANERYTHVREKVRSGSNNIVGRIRQSDVSFIIISVDSLHEGLFTYAMAQLKRPAVVSGGRWWCWWGEAGGRLPCEAFKRGRLRIYT